MRLFALSAGVIACAVLALAVPFTMSAAKVLPDQNLIAALEDGQERSDYKTALAHYQHATALGRDSQLQADLALLAASAARQGQMPWAEAEQALYTSLRSRPLDPVNWARLAYVIDAQNAKEGAGRDAQVRAALLQSIALGRFMPGFMQWRLILALSYWNGFSEPEQAIIAEQVALLWQKKRSNLIRLARIPALAPTLEAIITKYQPADVETFLRQRRPLRHTRATGAP